MDNLSILNTHEIKKIAVLLEDQWGFKAKLEYVFLMNNKSRIFLTTRDFGLIELKALRINSVGLYFGEITHERLRLSMEGSQIIGPGATKNIVEVNEQEEMSWLKGFDLEKECQDGFVIVKHKEHYLGCGSARQGRILNYVPKTRRIK
ncbi:MAG: hypothetical protein V1837_04220 [Candidatus Woesearchaeota archaeon]